MKKIVKILGVAALVVSLVATSFAQGAGPAAGPPQQGKHAGHMDLFAAVQKVLNQLDLSKDQKSQVKSLIKTTRDELKDLRKNTPPPAAGARPDPATMEKVRAIRKQFHEDLFKILTPTQQAKFKMLMKQLRDEQKNKGGAGEHPTSGPRP